MLISKLPIPGSLPASQQFNDERQLKHFLTLNGLSKPILENILQTATSFQEIATKPVKKVPLLRGKTIFNLFFETSTRTRTTFELAAKRLSADVMNVNISQSATSKGESLLDTIRNIEAMHTDMFIVRHAQSGAAQFIAQQVAPHISVVNAGDGWHSHPTQAMLDMLTIKQYKQNFEHLKVAIVGDVLHSRVARSQIQALSILGAAEIRVVAPKTLLPAEISKMGVHVYHSMEAGITDVDVIIMLRLQKERMSGAFIPSESEYFTLYGLNQTNLQLAKPDAIVMHPGPTNRGVEIAADVADGDRSVILQQVSNGLAMRMAIISMCLGTTQQSGVIA